MTHRFPIKEIARQAGLGPATVDRVLNNRAHVSPQTRARVAAALDELQAQERQLAARGRRIFVDVVVEAPKRFTDRVRAGCAAALPEVVHAAFRPRFLFQETMTPPEMVAALTRIRKRGSQGVLLKARDVPEVRGAVDALVAAGIPVLTLVTDLPGSRRRAYVGVNNADAGRTAAYLLARQLPAQTGQVLTSRSQKEFQGEAERFAAFRDCLAELCPDHRLIVATGGAGLAGDTERQVEQVLSDAGPIDAVYSMGGANRAILALLGAGDRAPHRRLPFIAHDLDTDNLALLRRGAISFVLHHDLALDMRRAFQALSAHYGLAAEPQEPLLSDVQIATPYNVPASL